MSNQVLSGSWNYQDKMRKDTLRETCSYWRHISRWPPRIDLHPRRRRPGTVGPIFSKRHPSPLTPGRLDVRASVPYSLGPTEPGPATPFSPCSHSPALTCERPCFFNLVWSSLTALDRTPLSPEGAAWPRPVSCGRLVSPAPRGPELPSLSLGTGWSLRPAGLWPCPCVFLPLVIVLPSLKAELRGQGFLSLSVILQRCWRPCVGACLPGIATTRSPSLHHRRPSAPTDPAPSRPQ